MVLSSPATSTLEIKNTSDDLELLIYSLSTDDLQFYPSNVMYTSIAPGGSANDPPSASLSPSRARPLLGRLPLAVRGFCSASMV